MHSWRQAVEVCVDSLLPRPRSRSPWGSSITEPCITSQLWTQWRQTDSSILLWLLLSFLPNAPCTSSFITVRSFQRSNIAAKLITARRKHPEAWFWRRWRLFPLGTTFPMNPVRSDFYIPHHQTLWNTAGISDDWGSPELFTPSDMTTWSLWSYRDTLFCQIQTERSKTNTYIYKKCKDCEELLCRYKKDVLCLCSAH